MSKATAYAVTLSRFATDCGFTVEEAAEVVRIAKHCCHANTHSCNGDRHPRSADLNDKNLNSAEWDKDLDRWTAKLTAIVRPKGFTVEYNGLMPTLHRDGTSMGASIFIPTDK